MRAPCSAASPNCWVRAPMPRISRSSPWWRATCRAIIRTDEVRLRQVLTNLMGNAVKFTEKGGVCVAADDVDRAASATVLRVEVRDTGVGVPPQKRQDIFQEFVQADSSHARKFGGSGLGLAISKRLVETMGGEIGIESGAGRRLDSSGSPCRRLMVEPAPPRPTSRCKASASPSSPATRCCARA